MAALNRLVLCLALLGFCLAGGGGCISVKPPGKPLDPVAVYLCDYGVHSSLLLPTGEGEFVEYCWGDWGYSAENVNGPQDALGALFLSGKAAMGRRFHPAGPRGEPPAVLVNQPDQTADLQQFYAARAKVEQVVGELDVRYKTGLKPGKLLYNPVNGVTYAEVDGRYGLWNNCNHLTTWCLKRMDCKVAGLIVFANYNVKGARKIPAPKLEPAEGGPPTLASAAPGNDPPAASKPIRAGAAAPRAVAPRAAAAGKPGGAASEPPAAVPASRAAQPSRVQATPKVSKFGPSSAGANSTRPAAKSPPAPARGEPVARTTAERASPR